MKIDNLVQDEYELHEYLLALDELTSHNKDTFLRVMNKYLETQNKQYRDVFTENLDIFTKSLLTLRKSNRIPSTEQIMDLNELLSGLGNFLDSYGYEGTNPKKARRIYLVLHDYLVNLPKKIVEHSEVEGLRPELGYGEERDEHLCIVGYEKFDMNTSRCVPVQTELLQDNNYQYAKFYYKVLDENVSRVQQGLSVLNREDYDVELSDIEELAFQDAIKHIHYGESMLGSRGNLNEEFSMSREEQTDRKIMSASSRVLDRLNEERIKKIRFMENLSTTELKEDTWLNKKIIELIKERR